LISFVVIVIIFFTLKCRVYSEIAYCNLLLITKALKFYGLGNIGLLSMIKFLPGCIRQTSGISLPLILPRLLGAFLKKWVIRHEMFDCDYFVQV